MWSGSIATIPSGWYLCDGNNSTPDLTDRFVIHADADSGGTNDVDDTGGSNTISEAQLPSHTHGDGTLATDSDSHSHSWSKSAVARSHGSPGDGDYDGGNIGQTADINSDSHSHDVTGDTGSTGSGSDYKPKFYALAYIMKG